MKFSQMFVFQMLHNVFVYDLVAILESCSSLAFAESADEGGRQKMQRKERGFLGNIPIS